MVRAREDGLYAQFELGKHKMFIKFCGDVS
jgi:hypothetical protein